MPIAEAESSWGLLATMTGITVNIRDQERVSVG